MRRFAAIVGAVIGLAIATTPAFAYTVYWSSLKGGGFGNSSSWYCANCKWNRMWLAYGSIPPNHPFTIMLAVGLNPDPAGAYISGLNDVKWGRSGTPYSRTAYCWIPSPYGPDHSNCEAGS